MNDPTPFRQNPALDLVLERAVDVPPERLWLGWTTPEIVRQWFAPAPWKTIDCEIDLRPGGVFRTVMQSPDGQSFPHVGCYLDVVPNERLVWTNALGLNYRPNTAAFTNPCITAIITFVRHGTGTKYTAVAMHKDEDDRRAHEAMGFHEGWGMALDQLLAAVRDL